MCGTPNTSLYVLLLLKVDAILPLGPGKRPARFTPGGLVQSCQGSTWGRRHSHGQLEPTRPAPGAPLATQLQAVLPAGGLGQGHPGV